MIVRFWGVRGSIPVPGPDTIRFGGNTPCVEVEMPGNQTLILDAGTGIRSLGLDLLRRGEKPGQIVLLISHTHWDHIQGLPFFAPIRSADYRVEIVGEPRSGRSLERLLAMQMDSAYLPFSTQDLEAVISFQEARTEEPLAVGGGTRVRAARLPHPGSVLGYRMSCQGRQVVYATDVSHPLAGPDRAVVDLARGADLLIHDAHFTPEEKLAHPDWGHSSWLEAVRVAQEAGVRQLALFHHAPGRTDEELERIEQEARDILPGAFAAREGMEVAL